MLCYQDFHVGPLTCVDYVKAVRKIKFFQKQRYCRDVQIAVRQIKA